MSTPDWPGGKPVVSAFSWLIITVGEPNSLWVVPTLNWCLGCYGKADWVSNEEQTISSTLPWLLLKVLPTGPSCCLSFCIDFLKWSLWCGSVDWNTPFPPPSCFRSLYFITVTETLRKMGTRTPQEKNWTTNHWCKKLANNLYSSAYTPRLWHWI